MKVLIILLLCIFLTIINSQKDLLPNKFDLKLSIVDFATVSWTLIKQNTIDDNKIPVVTTTNKEWHSKNHQKIGNYENKRRTVSFSVEVFEENGKFKKKYFGSFSIGKDVFSLKPADENIIEGALKSYTVDIDGVSHIVSETEKKIKFENNPDLKKKRKRSKRSVRRTKRQARQTATIEILVVVDYSVYSTWLKYNSNKKDTAIANLMAYYSHIVMGIDNKFGSIVNSKYRYTARLSGLYITESKYDSITEKATMKVGNRLDYDEALKEIKVWVAKKKSVLPKHDVLALFTKYKSTGKNSGLGSLGSTCEERSNSITLDVGVYGTADIAAHEIGHNMGAEHDGQENSCDPNAQYLMTAVQTGQGINNHHTFSSCSINYFDKHASMKENKCLFEQGQEIDTSVHKKKLLGTIFSLDEQCKHTKGPDSYFCSYGEKSDKGACEKIYCYDPIQNECLGGKTKAYDGTTCGNKQWCINGHCVKDYKAPSNKDKCIHGEAKDTMLYNRKPTKCNEFAVQRSACESPIVSQRCCETCAKATKANPSCPFGDKFNNCKELKNNCGDTEFRKGCCDTCEKMKDPSTPSCLYGDSVGNCASFPGGCHQPEWRSKCCRTCEKIRKSNPRGCPYGDFYGNCATLLRGCKTSQDIKTKCCKTCKMYS